MRKKKKWRKMKKKWRKMKRKWNSAPQPESALVRMRKKKKRKTRVYPGRDTTE